METRKIGMIGLQTNAIAYKLENNIVDVLLADGKTARLDCPNKDDAQVLLDRLMWTDIKSNSGYEFNFYIDVTILTLKQ
jgi:hypothetical protein